MTTSIDPSRPPRAMVAAPATTDAATQTPATSAAITLPGPGPWYLSEGDDNYSFDLTPGINTTIYALSGNDAIFAYGGVATLYGALGSDYLYADGYGAYLDGGDDNDTLWAAGGRASLIGGNGNDALYALNTANGINALDGGAGNDFLVIYDGVGTAILTGGDGNDTMYVGSGGSTTWFFGGTGDDVLYPGSGPAFIDGGDGYDTVKYGFSAIPVTINLLDQQLNAGGAAGQILVNIERYWLSNSSDTFIASEVADIVNGGQGDDFLQGRAGDDLLDGGAGADTLIGDEGSDTASYLDATVGISIDLTKASSTWTGDAQGDVFSSIEEIYLSNFADTFRGDANANIVNGADGDDQIFGGGGDDELTGGNGNDTIQGGDDNDFVRGDGYSRNPGDDYLQGNAGDDVLFGDGGNDRMVGGIGNDTLRGGLGGDYLVGSEGADIFQYTAVEESQSIVINGVIQHDQIVDFTQGEDKIDLSAIDANPTLDGDQAFTFIADPAHYTGDWTGVVWQTTDPRSGIATINVSIDGDADAEMQIYMSHPYQFTANDFIL